MGSSIKVEHVLCLDPLVAQGVMNEVVLHVNLESLVGPDQKQPSMTNKWVFVAADVFARKVPPERAAQVMWGLRQGFEGLQEGFPFNDAKFGPPGSFRPVLGLDAFGIYGLVKIISHERKYRTNRHKLKFGKVHYIGQVLPTYCREEGETHHLFPVPPQAMRLLSVQAEKSQFLMTDRIIEDNAHRWLVAEVFVQIFNEESLRIPPEDLIPRILLLMEKQNRCVREDTLAIIELLRSLWEHGHLFDDESVQAALSAHGLVKVKESAIITSPY